MSLIWDRQDAKEIRPLPSEVELRFGNLGNPEFRKWLGEYRRKVSCGTAEGRSVKAEPSSYCGLTPEASLMQSNGEAAESTEIRFGFISKGQSGYQAPPAGIPLAASGSRLGEWIRKFWRDK